MQLPKTISPRPSGGYALIVTMCFLAVALIAYASMMNWVSTNAHITKRNNLFTQSQAAAESATESVLAYMVRDYFNQGLNPVSVYTDSTNLPSQSNWPVGFQFSDTNGNPNTTSVSIGLSAWTTLPAQYAGLNGIGQPVEIASQATPINSGENISATIYQNVWFGIIPIFQFAIFYNMDLEINPGAAMTINGRVHSNGNIYATGSGSGLIFSTNVEAAATNVYTTPSPLDPQNVGRSGNVTFTDTDNNPLSHALSLALPIGTNNSSVAVIGILGIPPAGTVANSTNGQQYPYNEADIIITNDYYGTNLLVYYQNLNNANPQTLVPMDITNITITGYSSTNPVTHVYYTYYATNTYYSFTTNVTFYDYRESQQMKAVQIDVGKFRTWLTNSIGGLTYQNNNLTGSYAKGHGIDGVYVYNSISNSSSQTPAVRVINGSRLPPPGFTVATPFPLYVEGSFNTTTDGVNFSTTLGDVTNTYAAALMGDAVTILSAGWSDAYNSSTSLTSRGTSTTTINAACLEGIVPSNGTSYSGGVENFLRLLENWSGVTIYYNGSIVVLFQSQYNVHPWQAPGGSVYNAPVRQWGFDTNFQNPSLLPPMTPSLRAWYRSQWASW